MVIIHVLLLFVNSFFEKIFSFLNFSPKSMNKYSFFVNLYSFLMNKIQFSSFRFLQFVILHKINVFWCFF